MKNSKEVGLFFAALAIRLVFSSLIPEYGDACRYLVISKNLSEDIGLLAKSGIYYPPPFFHIVTALVFVITKILAPSCAASAMKLVSPVFGSMTIPLVYFIGKRLFDERTGEYAAVLLVFNPIHIAFSSLAYTDVFFTFWVSLSVALFIQLLDSANITRSIILGLSMGFVGLSRELGPLLFIVLPISLLFLDHVKVSRIWRHLLLALLIGTLIAFPYYGRSLIEFGTLLPGSVTGRRIIAIDGKIALDPDVTIDSPITEPRGTTLLLRVIGTYYEYWGIIDGKIASAFSAFHGIPAILIWFSVGMYGVLALYPTILHLVGICTAWKRREARVLHLWIVILLFAYAYLLLASRGIETIGFRKPLFSTISSLSILAATGLRQYEGWLDRLPEKRLNKQRFRFVPIAICFIVFLAAVAIESFYLRQRYSRLTDGSEWLRTNTNTGTVVLTSRPSEIAYYSERSTVDMKAIRDDRITLDTFRRYGIRYILIPREDEETPEISPKMPAINGLVSQRALKLVYETSASRIWEVTQ